MSFAISCRSPQSARIKHNLLNNRCIAFLNFAINFFLNHILQIYSDLYFILPDPPQSAGNRKTHRQSALSLYATKVRSKGASHVFMLRYASQNIGASQVFMLRYASQNIGASQVFMLRYASQNIVWSRPDTIYFRPLDGIFAKHKSMTLK